LLVLDAGPIAPRQALEAGLVDRLCPPDRLLDETVSFAEKVARTAGRRGVSAAKRAVFHGAELPFAEAMEFDEGVHWDAVRRSNFAETTAAFMKRFA
jgi:enoyl-CoA hydratase/carnithine racemase